MGLNYYNPPQKKIQDQGLWGGKGPKGGLKGNCQKKYKMEVKTVKAKKMTKWSQNVAKIPRFGTKL